MRWTRRFSFKFREPSDAEKAFVQSLPEDESFDDQICKMSWWTWCQFPDWDWPMIRGRRLHELLRDHFYWVHGEEWQELYQRLNRLMAIDSRGVTEEIRFFDLREVAKIVPRRSEPCAPKCKGCGRRCVLLRRDGRGLARTPPLYIRQIFRARRNGRVGVCCSRACCRKWHQRKANIERSVAEHKAWVEVRENLRAAFQRQIEQEKRIKKMIGA